MTDERLVEQIYEAAVIPERWERVLSGLCEIGGNANGTFLLFDGDGPPRFRATEAMQPALDWFCDSGAWMRNGRRRLESDQFNGFIRVSDHMAQADLEADSVQEAIRRAGMAFQAGTAVAMPTAEMVVLTQERSAAQGLHDDAALAVLDGYRPHLARAAMLAARLRLEQAQSMVEVFARLGLPAAVLSRGRRVLATNAAFEQDATGDSIAEASGRLGLTDARAHALLCGAFDNTAQAAVAPARSIPAATTQDGAMVLHLIPLHRDTRDLLGGGDVLMVVTRAHPASPRAGPVIVPGLFDLTPAEARLATRLAAGDSLQAAADGCGIKISTARSYLETIFAKTCTDRQAGLVALLRSLSVGMGPAPE